MKTNEQKINVAKIADVLLAELKSASCCVAVGPALNAMLDLPRGMPLAQITADYLMPAVHHIEETTDYVFDFAFRPNTDKTMIETELWLWKKGHEPD